ncbi:MAG: thioredoxin family protein [Verrucomicrobiae bacterium]
MLRSCSEETSALKSACRKGCRGAALLAQALFCFHAPGLDAQTADVRQPVKAELISSAAAVVPGRPLEVGLLLEMAPGWHTYWEYSGDAGLPTKITWSLPDGFHAGPIQWPAPHLMIEPGDIWTYGYGERVLLITTIIPPKDLKAPVTLRGKASWLACRDLCVPGSAELQLDLPVSTASAPDHAGLFAEFRSLVPSAEAPPFRLNWKKSGAGLALSVANLPVGEKAGLFPLPSANQDPGHPKSDSPGQFHVQTSEGFRGVLAVGQGDGRRAWLVESAADPAPKSALWLALFYGFLGGLILNLMPCVLPVISLKVFGFIRQAGEAPGKIFAHGLAFAGGIFAWFLGLAAAVILLKSGGTEVTWAFQFQNPWFNAAIGSVVFVFALNLFGVFEILLPGRASNAMASASGGLGGSFFQGVFATLLATPCTAPFLGTALGFAFSQSAAVILAMFAAVAFGMASPYLLLTARPGWMRFLPRPGVWMEKLKQFMGFPLLATLVWIIGIIGAQRGTGGVFWFLCFLLCLALACWIYGSFCGPIASPRGGSAAILLVLIVAVGGGWYFLGEKFSRSGAVETGGIAWVPFSAKALSDLRAEGKPVFVDFTADWCITCKFNERTAIDTPAVRALLAEKKVVPMKADWTNANPEITAALRNFGRVGVPFYVIWTAGSEARPVTLPEILTEAIMVEALKKLP